MKDAGIGLGAIGLLAALIGLFVNVGRRVGYGVGEVANLHAMHVQSLVIIGGLIVFLSGVVLFAAGAINESIQAGSGTKQAATISETTEPVPIFTSEAREGENGGISHSTGMRILIGAALLIVVIVGAGWLLSRSSNPTPRADNAVELNAYEMDLNAPLPYPELNGPADVYPDLNAPLPPPPPLGNAM